MSPQLLTEPLRLALQGIADRMQGGMMRAAYSSVAREGGDCAAALFLPDGQLIAQARSLPLLLGSLIPAAQGLLAAFPVSAMREGDAYLMNDPWSGGTHLPDFMVMAPIVDAGRVIALAMTCLHQQDVGGATPGSIPPNASDIHQEGLRIPPVRWRVGGEPDAGIAAMLAANSRMPLNLAGDLAAQWAAVCLGGRELIALADRLGAQFEPGCRALLAQAEAMTRAALARAPDGRWSWEDQLDGDGIESKPVPIRLVLEKHGDRLIADFTGSSPETRGPVNASRGSMLSAALFFMRSLAPEAPNNAGCLAPLTLVLPEASVVNPSYPAALNARTATVKLACNALLGAWAQAGASEAVAPHAGVATVLSLSGRRLDGSRWMFTEIIASGAGASAREDGTSGASTDVGNARNTPLESLEAEAPIRMERYAIREGSGGAGLHTGGHGVVREYRLLEGEGSISYRGERHASQARGAAGGGPGAPARARIERADGSRLEFDARARADWRAGDRLIIETAGAGGFGAPLALSFASSLPSASRAAAPAEHSPENPHPSPSNPP